MKRDRRRTEVIEAAAAVFAEKGYHEATTKDIADRIGLLPGSLYYYLDSKEAALVEVCRRQGRGFNLNLQAVVEGEGSFSDKVRAGIRLHMRNNYRDLAFSLAFNRSSLPEAVQPEMRALARDYQRLWERIFQSGVADGDLPESFDCHLAAIALLGLCNGSVDWYGRKSVAEIERIADRYAGYFLHGILVDGA